MSTEKEPKKRRGKAEKPKAGEPAVFVPGAATGPRDFNAAAVAEELHLWWENGGGQTFIVGHDAKLLPGASAGSSGGSELFAAAPQTFSDWPESKVANLLRLKFVRAKKREGEQLSEVDRVFMHVMEKRRLAGSLNAIPGYRAGVHEINGARVLVRTSPPRLLDFRKGEWPTVRALIEGKLDLLDDEGRGIVQSEYFHAWMKKAVESLYMGGPGNFQSGQCLVFAGPADVGKSRIQHQVITEMLGGRSADPSSYLFGKSDFNAEIFSAEHVMMEEMEQTSTKAVDRTLFGERVKKLVSADRQRLHAKRADAQMVAPFFRVTITINNDPDKMRMLFLLTPDMRDKVMLFLVSDAPLPMPTKSLEERAAFRAKILEELPAYGHWLLNEFVVPEKLEKGRFGVASWHHPTLAMELFDDTPAAELLALIDAAEFTAGGASTGADDVRTKYKLWDLKSKAETEGAAWEGSALELERLLLGEASWGCSVMREMKKLSLHNKIDRLLSRLKEDQGDRVSQHRTKIERRWVVSAP
jgi:hypothetical protein